MKRHDLGQYPTELLMTSLVCKVGLYYSSASINQLFDTKNSLLHLLSGKATLKCEVLFKGTNGRQKTCELFHVYCIFYSGSMC